MIHNPESCVHHLQLAVDIATIKEKLNHVERSYWRACFISGLLGGLLGKIVPDFFLGMTKLLGF